jgi:uracil-DNA glycosylase family 4
MVAHHKAVRCRHPGYHAAPVGSWGARRPRLLIVGLAPGLHGAARTGKAFVGDSSGEFLFKALYRCGIASSADPASATLRAARITNAVKCLPPNNAPTRTEIDSCAQHLIGELKQFCGSPRNRRHRVVVCLGGVAHASVCRALGIRQFTFTHGGTHRMHAGCSLVSSFHPSRLNVNTGRLDQNMLEVALKQAQQLLG